MTQPIHHCGFVRELPGETATCPDCEELPQSHESLEEERLGLLQDKSDNDNRLAEINAALKTVPPAHLSSTFASNLRAERTRLVLQNTEIESEIREIRQELITRNLANDSKKKSLTLITTLVAARIASGDTRPVSAITPEAIADLATIDQLITTAA